MGRVLWIAAAVVLVILGLAGCMTMMSVETEKPLPVITESASPAVMQAPVQGAAAKPARTELASFAAG